MIKDDRILSVGNVYNAVKTRVDLSSYTEEPSNPTKLANLDYFAKLVDLAVDGSLKNRPISVRNLKKALSLISTNPFYDYTLLEYVYTGGDCYIDTGYKANQNTCVVGYFYTDVQSSKNYPLMGYRKTSSSNDFIVWTDNEGYWFDYGGKRNTVQTFANGACFFVFDGKNHMITINNKTVSLSSKSFSCEETLLLFATRQNGTLDPRRYKGRLYELAIYDDGVMVSYFFPAKNSSGQIGLLDIIQNNFHIPSENFESLTPGPELMQFPNWTESKYDFLEYAQANSDVYFDTQFTPNSNTRFVMNFKKLSNDFSVARYMFGSRSVTPGIFTGGYGLINPKNVNSFRDDYNKSSDSLQFTGSDLSLRSVVDKNKNITTLQGITVSHTATSMTSPCSMAIFGIFEQTDKIPNYAADMNFYWARLYDNDSLIRYYVAAKRKSDNAIGLYDFVNKEFVLPFSGNLISGNAIPKYLKEVHL